MSDLDALKATFEKVENCYDTHDVATMASLMHEDVVIYTTFSPFPIAGKATAQKYFQLAFAAYDKTISMPIEPSFQVVGDTGIVWGPNAVTLKPIDGPVQNIYTRQAWTFVNVGGQWLVLLLHQSLLPSGN